MTNESNRIPEHFTDTDGAACVRLPLAGDAGSVILDRDDFDALTAQGLTANWCFNRAGKRAFGYVRAGYRGEFRTVARLVVQAGKGEHVRYRDGNPFNLRHENLEVVAGGVAKIDCAELLAEGAA